MSPLIRPAAPADDPAVLDLLTRCLGWDDGRADSAARHLALFRWKHRDNAFGPSPAWVAVADERVVGYRALMRWEFESADGVVRAVRAVDTATHPEARGAGVFRALTTRAVDDLAADGVGVVFNTPNDQSRPGYLKMGWVDVERLPVAVRVRSPLAAARTVRARQPADLWSVPGRLGRPAGEALRDPAPVTALLERLGPPGPRWRTRRSAAYLCWRYGLRELGYRVVAAPGGVADGAAVVRLRRRGPALELVLCELLAPDRRTARRLVRTALRASGADHLTALGRPAGTVPLRRLGPRLTARTLATSPPAAGGWDLTLGDIELF